MHSVAVGFLIERWNEARRPTCGVEKREGEKFLAIQPPFRTSRTAITCFLCVRREKLSADKGNLCSVGTQLMALAFYGKSCLELKAFPQQSYGLMGVNFRHVW